MTNPNTKIPFFQPSIGWREQQAVRRVMRRRWLTTGPEALAFEKEFAAVLESGAPDSSKAPIQAISVNSATAGLRLALEAVGVGPGDYVAVPSLTFTATAGTVRHLGAHPLFVDSLENGGTLSPSHLEQMVLQLKSKGKYLKAVIPVHLAGRVCDINAIRRALGESPTLIIEDSAHAFPSRTKEGMAGDLGDIGVFSFYATKTITTGEGGMVCTRNPDFLQRISLMRLHGIDRTVWNRYGANAGHRPWEYDIQAPGDKCNLPDLCAAIGRVQLQRANHLHQQRKNLAHLYLKYLEDLPQVQCPQDAEGHAWHLFAIRLKNEETRNQVSEFLEKRGIGTSVHFIPLHTMSYWKRSSLIQAETLPVATSLGCQSLSLPLWPGMGKKEIKRVTQGLREALNA
ncbi:MAG: DegT/DnrJ/EryC1/StrS family aminotransferase [Spirochaetales bacterium]|nr:DegT/DnrJ/EryC1/StrS family aminotransferase [Spirochaetales bacterium]